MTALRFELSWPQAFTWSLTLACLGSALHGLQLVSLRHEFYAGGWLSWGVLRTSHPRLMRSSAAALFDWWLSPPALWLLVGTQVVAAVVVIAGAAAPPLWALGAVVAIRGVLNFRNAPALIGADQMQMSVLVACLLYVLQPHPAVAEACGWFIGLQLVVAYMTAGVSKLASPDWRSGRAIVAVVRCRTIGLRAAFTLMQRMPAAARAVCWATMCFEIAGPLLFAAGANAGLAFVIAGTIFHAGIALVMGFDEFLWAYLSAYPVTLRCAVDLERWLQGNP
jgi:hypothetical protein